jgi:hypothetical protein
MEIYYFYIHDLSTFRLPSLRHVLLIHNSFVVDNLPLTYILFALATVLGGRVLR